MLPTSGIPVSASFQEYQESAKQTAGSSIDFLYHGYAICGEAGEVAEILKKYHYTGARLFKGKDFDSAMKEEIGDVLWGLANCCNYFGWSLSDIAQQNTEKLAKRFPDGNKNDGGIR